MFRQDDGAVHVSFHLFVDFAYEEMLEDRQRQRAYLARYARQPWNEEMTIPEMQRRVKLISEMVQKENAPVKTSEG